MSSEQDGFLVREFAAKQCRHGADVNAANKCKWSFTLAPHLKDISKL